MSWSVIVTVDAVAASSAVASPAPAGSASAARGVAPPRKAAKTLSAEPNAIQLRYLQTLTEIAGDKSSTIVFPLDLIKKLGGNSSIG